MCKNFRAYLIIPYLLACAIALHPQQLCFAQPAKTKPQSPQKKDLKAEIIALTFKILAKAVLTSDVEKLKENAKKKISSMNDDLFTYSYNDFLEHLDNCAFLIKTYNLTPSLSKAGAIGIIDSLDKPKISQIIDNLPTEIIIGEINRFASKHKEISDPVNQTEMTIQQFIGTVKDKYLGK